jgi:hypothetical protein
MNLRGVEFEHNVHDWMGAIPTSPFSAPSCSQQWGERGRVRGEPYEKIAQNRAASLSRCLHFYSSAVIVQAAQEFIPLNGQ